MAKRTKKASAKGAGRKAGVTKAAAPKTAGRKAAAKPTTRKAATKKAASKRTAAKGSRRTAAGKPSAGARKTAARKPAPKASAAKTAAAKTTKASKRTAKTATPRKPAGARNAIGRLARRVAPSLKRVARVAGRIVGAVAPKAAGAKKAGPAKAPAKAPAQRSRTPRPTRVQTDPVREKIPSSLDPGGASAARSGREELLEHLKEHTETGPGITAGDLDADWQTAYSSGDEAPGGDNPTPDQDIVDDIGHALGVEYGPTEELQGANKIEERDRHRWELDPASSDDYAERRRDDE